MPGLFGFSFSKKSFLQNASDDFFRAEDLASKTPGISKRSFFMSSAMFMERTSMGSQNMMGTTVGWQPTPSAPSAMPGNWCVLPRCEYKFEKCEGGFKIHCICEDEVACGTLQNLCRMLADGMCSCCVTQNGMVVCQCNITMGHCSCEFTKDGVCITCMSGDQKCCEMLQACCDCLACCCEAGGCCYLSFGNTPVCCGTCAC